MIFNDLQKYISEKYVQETKHPSGELFIYNYTQTTQYERKWDDLTLICRGLILDKNQNIVARPFVKFFNLEELKSENIPNESFEIFEKMDGSLGILYWWNDLPHIATRGSFMGIQAQIGTQILHEKYAHTFDVLDRNKTYLFEIIYPENRIVVDYGAIEDLILLAIIDNTTGEDLPLQNIGFQLVKRYDGIKNINDLKAMQEENREGFVLKFQNGLRVKVKFEEYLRLHRIITQISTTDIWEHLKDNHPLDEILDRVPDEFYEWVKKTVDILQKEYAAVEADCKANFKILENRKETAAYFNTLKHSKVLFAMLDEKDFKTIIWRIIKPEWSKPFANNGEV